MLYADLKTAATFALDAARRSYARRAIVFDDAFGAYSFLPVDRAAESGSRVVAVVAPSGACHFVEAD